MAKHNQKVTPQVTEDIYGPVDWFVLRTPLLPIERYFALTRSHQKISNAVADALAVDPKVATALSIGNPSLFDAFKRFDSDKQDADSERLMGKLLRLLIRMSTRCTPMGMYAGLAIGKWDDKTDLSIGETGTRLWTRPDTEMIASLALRCESALLKELHVVVNPTAALHVNRVYVIEKAAVLDEEDVNGVTIEATPEIKTIMSLARTPITYNALLTQLVQSSKIPQADLEQLIQRLVKTTFLLTNLRPSNVVGEAERLLAILKTIPGSQDISERLGRFMNSVREFDLAACAGDGFSNASSDALGKSQMTNAGDTGNDFGSSYPVDLARQYSDLTATGQAIFATKSGVSLQTDMQLSLSGKSVNKSILKDVGELLRLTVALSTGPATPLADYKKRFTEMYGEREIPLLELVNPDVGLGLPSNVATEWSAAPGLNQAHVALLTELAFEAIRHGKLEVELRPEILERLLEKSEQQKSADVRYPLSLDVMFTLLAESPSAIDAGNYLLVHSGAIVEGAGRLLGRFAYMLDSEEISKLDDLLLEEKNLQSSKLMADISSLPRKLRLGNVCTIPILRPFHIATDSGPVSSHQSQPLVLNDLVVGLQAGRFYVRSISHGSEVVICSAHVTNPLFGTALSKFLQEISSDGFWIPSGFRWGSLADAPFLPRVRHKRVILCPALWNIKPSAKDRELWKTEAGFEQWLLDWRQRWFVPQHLYLTAADNRLLIDLENGAQTSEFRRELLDERTTSIQLEEAFVGDKNVWMPGPGGRFVSEFIAMFLLSKKRAEAQEPKSSERSFTPTSISPEYRNRLPGTDCLYIKLYGGKNLEDELISTSLLNVLNQLSERCMIDAWFFIRYEDPDRHLRLRVFGNSHTLTSQVYPLFCQLGNLLCKDLVRKKITIETYEREIERYGGIKAMALAEQLFAADSVFVATLLQQERNEVWNETRSDTCAFTIDKLLEALGLNAEDRLAWYKPYTTAVKVKAGQAYRERKDALSKLFLKGDCSDNSVIDTQLVHWQRKLREFGRQYSELDGAGFLTTPLPVIYRSFVHMHCNRLGLDNEEEALALALAERACQCVQSRQKNLLAPLSS